MSKIVFSLRKVIMIAICLTVSSVIFSICNQSGEEIKLDLNSETKQDVVDMRLQDEGVLINGVKWATRNVDKPGAFAAKPEEPGMFYKWNDKVGWSTTDPVKNSNGGTVWDNAISEGTSWEIYNDPSPDGWRIPTDKEIGTLFDKDKVDHEWTTVNGVTGRKFTDKTTGNFIFMPAIGVRESTGSLYYTGQVGHYWSNTMYDNTAKFVRYLTFQNNDARLWGDYNTGLKSIRCVSE